MRNHFRWHQVKTQVLVCKSLISNKECPCHPAFNFKYKILNSSLGIERPIFTFVNVAQPCSRLRNVVEFGNKFQLLPLWESWSWQKSKEEKYLRNIAFEKVFLGTENVLERWIGIHCKSLLRFEYDVLSTHMLKYLEYDSSYSWISFVEIFNFWKYNIILFFSW